MLHHLKNAIQRALGQTQGLSLRLPTPLYAQAVLLDLDGTLVDSAPDLVAAANSVRIELGLPTLPFDTVVNYVGKGAESLLHRTLTGDLAGRAEPALLARGMAIFARVYSEINGDQTTVYPGVRAGLDALLAEGLKLALVTNKPAQFTEPLLLKKSLLNYFDVIVTGNSCAHKKPHPEPLLFACQELGVAPTAAIAIGDSLNDAQAARAANMRVLAVPYGYNEGQDTRQLDVDGIVPNLLQAAQVIRLGG
ncbi:phosphoglycolate phosphatase [Parvibium lacunae]|uniref:Phosphoglycolate phosphatase n=1 Tax=Parvibium lacunae TaxID=1888893 RepID=A0A368L4U4_9BURK|nr:phosphoglycolate phosphatase [Parvibium lacunae]RCS58608.1 phosphoglycolate phosphatase [Parvibium lacunae]